MRINSFILVPKTPSWQPRPMLSESTHKGKGQVDESGGSIDRVHPPDYRRAGDEGPHHERHCTHTNGHRPQLMRHFLYDTCNPTPGDIPETHPMAREMMTRTQYAKCPSGIIIHACANWNRNRRRQFYGRSHTAPTQREHTIQQLGLAVVKAYGNHLQKAETRMGYHSNPPKGRGNSNTHKAGTTGKEGVSINVVCTRD